MHEGRREDLREQPVHQQPAFHFFHSEDQVRPLHNQEHK